MSKPTPGPWTYTNTGKYIYTDNQSPIMTLEYQGHICKTKKLDEQTRIANARLIAAAPELLEALELAVKQNTIGGLEVPWIRQAQQAIAKAKE